MDSGAQAPVLQKLLDRLCQETDQRKIYKTLKELSAVPILCDRLAEIGFRQTIKHLKKQQLLVQFVKDLVGKWSTGLPQARQGFDLEKSRPTEQQSNSPEEKAREPAYREARGAGREGFVGPSSCSQGKISHPSLSPSVSLSGKSQARSDPRAPHFRSRDPGETWSPEQQLAGQNVVQVPPPCKRKRELPCQAEVQRPAAQGPPWEGPSSKNQSLIAACSIPESHSNGQDFLQWDDVLESSPPQQDQEAHAWGWSERKNHRTQVYAGRRPAACLQHKSHLGLLDHEAPGTWEVAHCQAGKDKAGPVQLQEKSQPESQTCKQTHGRPESHTGLQLQESREETLQRIRARIQSKSAKRPQARQTMMISFHNQQGSPGLQGEPGLRGGASAQNSHSLPRAPAHPGAQRASCLTSAERGSKKAPAKRPAPLMAKALRDYSNRFSTK